jgi:hypothetical protein
MGKHQRQDDDLGIVAPKKGRGELLSVRLSTDNMRKLEALGKRLDVGRSTMARLILEKFIAEHDPDQRGKR